MNREEIMGILPHRGKMLLLDQAALLEDGRACGEYTVKGDEWFLDGHFPGDPVMPGVLQCEIMAQASCLLLKEALGGKTAYYAGIDKMRFRRMVRPGDTLRVTSQLIRQKLNLYVVAAEATVAGEVCASGQCSFIIPE
ncbi:MAG: 3-hydroxyacyl-ACP dehydratase FabZ [Clostridia bacterium]